MNKILIIIVVFLVITLNSGCIDKNTENSVTISDFSISDFKYETPNADSSPIYVSNGVIEAWFSFVISTNKHGSFKVSDVNNGNILVVDENRLLNSELVPGNTKFYRRINLDNINQQSQLRFYFSGFDEYNKKNNMDLDIAKNEILPAPKIDISIFPAQITFYISKKNDNPNSRIIKEINIQNTGDVIIWFEFYAPDSGSDDTYSKYYPQYASGDPSFLLSPGQSKYFKFYPIIEDTQPGTYESVGYVCVRDSIKECLNSVFKKEFKIKTIVTE